MLERIIEKFVEEYTVQCPHATKEEVRKVLNDALVIIENNKDATPEEIVRIMIDDCAKSVNEILEKYPTPGIASGLKVGNIDVYLHGGKFRTDGEALTRDALFDVASISKLYTEVMAYKLISEGAFKLTDKIRELDPRFVNVGDLTVEEILRFIVSFRTDGRLEDAGTREEALDRLLGITVVQRGQEYNYNDMGLMIMKEVMETVTGKSFSQLFKEYITEPYGLSETFIDVPKDKVHLVTGTPNADGTVNDLKTAILAGTSGHGHAGVRATSDDLLAFMQAFMSDYTISNGVYVPNEFQAKRSNKMGNVYVNPKTIILPDGREASGVEAGYAGKLATADTAAAQGSTRVIEVGSRVVLGSKEIIVARDAVSNISSLYHEAFLEAIKQRNAEIAAKDPNAKLLDSANLIKERYCDGEKRIMHDPRQIMPEGQSIGSILYKYDNEVVLKLLLLNMLMTEYEHYYSPVRVEVDVTGHHK